MVPRLPRATMFRSPVRLANAIHCPQVYYPVPNEVYRDEWDDVQASNAVGGAGWGGGDRLAVTGCGWRQPALRPDRWLCVRVLQVTDPMEFTHCRYTPVVTEVRPLSSWGSQLLGGCPPLRMPAHKALAHDLKICPNVALRKSNPSAVGAGRAALSGAADRHAPPLPLSLLHRTLATLAWMATRCACSAWTARLSCSSASRCTMKTMTSCGRRLSASAM